MAVVTLAGRRVALAVPTTYMNDSGSSVRSLVTRFGIALLSIAPVIATILLLARYLRGEKDAYVRNLVVESMLWGLGAVLIAHTFFSYFQPDGSLIPIGNISPDIFVLAVSAKLEVKLWRNQ